MKIKFIWCDFWIGGYWDRKQRILYICPLPCVVFIFDFSKKFKGGKIEKSDDCLQVLGETEYGLVKKENIIK